jgi:hypothetical protein
MLQENQAVWCGLLQESFDQSDAALFRGISEPARRTRDEVPAGSGRSS